MANLRVNNQQNKFNTDPSRKPFKFYLLGNSVQIVGSRNAFMSFFENSVPTLFPLNGSAQYNATTTPTLVNFQTGTITGGDLFSGSFTPVIPPANQYVAASVFVRPNSSLGVVYRTPATASLSTVQSDIIADNYNVSGLIPTGSIRLFSVILTSTNGTTVSNLTEQNLYQFLGNYSVAPSAGKVLYNDSDTPLIEYFLDNSFAGQNTFITYKTLLKVGDTITCDRLESLVLTSEVKTVTGITYGATYDTVTVSPNFVGNYTTDKRPRAVKAVFDDAVSSSKAHFGNILADSGWIFVSSGDSGNVAHTINKHLNGIPVVYFNTSPSNTNVRLIPNGFIANVNQIGVWVYGESSGFNSLTYQVGNQGVFFDFEANTLRTAGYIRVILKKM